MKMKVLIVDDDEVVLFLHDIMVRESGLSATPLVFNNGSKALAYLNEQTRQDEKYLMLLDINMPVMNGWQLLERLERSDMKDRIVVVMVTSSIDVNDARKARTFPLVIDYLEKPVTIEVCSRLLAKMKEIY
jgi:CheY-like chemotaxis protein